MDIKSKAIIPYRITLARESRGYSQKDLADLMDMSKQAINRYENGNMSPSDTALLKISQILNYPISFFEKGCPADNLTSGQVFFRSRRTTKVSEKKAACAKIMIFKEIADYFERYLEFPKLNLPQVKYHDLNEELNRSDIEEYAMELRKCWDLGSGPIPNLINVVQKNGIMVSTMKIGYSKIDAFSVFKDGRPYIFLSGDKESNAKIRFSIAHELGHMLMHSDLISEDDLDKNVIDTKLEEEANIFAAAFLLPRETFSRDVTSSSIDHFVRLKGKWLASIGSMIYRCDDLGLLTENQIRYLKSQMTSNRYWRKEPLDDKIQIEKPFIFRQAVELLLDSFTVTRSQLVTDIGCRADEIEKYCFLEEGTLKEKTPNNIIKLKDIVG